MKAFLLTTLALGSGLKNTMIAATFNSFLSPLFKSWLISSLSYLNYGLILPQRMWMGGSPVTEKEQDQILNALEGSVSVPLLTQSHCCLPTAIIYIILVFVKFDVCGFCFGFVGFCLFVCIMQKSNAFASWLCLHMRVDREFNFTSTLLQRMEETLTEKVMYKYTKINHFLPGLYQASCY